MDNIPDSPPPNLPPPERKMYTGSLRTDLELFRGEPEPDGSATWIVFDPVSDKYYRLSEEYHQIIGCMSENMELDAFMDKLRKRGVRSDKDVIMKVLSFLNYNNLMLHVYKVSEEKAAKHQEMKRKNLINIILYTYLFFKVPLLSPDHFLERTLGTVKKIFNKWTFFLLGIVTV